MGKEVNKYGSIILRIAKYSKEAGAMEWTIKEIGNPSNCLNNALNRMYIQKTIGLFLYNNSSDRINSINSKDEPTLKDLHEVEELEYFLNSFFSDSEYNEMITLRKELRTEAIDNRHKIANDDPAIIDKKAMEIYTSRLEKYISAIDYCISHCMIKFNSFDEARTVEPLSFMIAYSIFPKMYDNQNDSSLPHFNELFAVLDKVINADYKARDYRDLKNLIISFIEDNIWFNDGSIFKPYEMRVTDKLVDNFVRRTGDIAKLGKVKGKISGYNKYKLIAELLNFVFLSVFRFETIKEGSKKDGTSLRPEGLKKSLTKA